MASGELRGDRSGERVFTSLLWDGGPPATWPHHLARLSADSQRIGLPVVPADVIFAHVQAAVAAGPQRVRIDLVADGESHLAGPPTATVVRVSAAALGDTGPHTRGLELATVTTSCGAGNPLAGVKRPDAALWWARRVARAAGADDALLVCQSGHVVEAPTAALLLGLDDGQLVVPGGACGAVASTTLAWLETVVAVRRRTVDVTELPLVRWALLCNAVWGARPVAAFGHGALEPGGAQLQRWLRQAVGLRCDFSR